MEAQIAQFVNRGMYQDTAISKANNEFAFKNYNIRITAINDTTLLSVTNEKLPLELPIEISSKQLEINRLYFEENDYDRSITLRAAKAVDSTIAVSVIIKYESGIGDYYDKYEKIITIQKGASTGEELLLIDGSVDSASIKYYNSDDKYLYYLDKYEEYPTYINNSYDYLIGEYRGHAILNDYIVLFTHNNNDNKDYIYRLKHSDNKITGTILYEGYLGLENKIEALPYYESEDVQKVYWVDGKHQPRVINIVSSNIRYNNDSQFDFNPKLSVSPEVEITKKYEGLGLFNPGILQYYITYYNKYGAESGIIYSSDLQYVNFKDRAGDVNESIDCHFELKISNLDLSYDYMKVYSIKRTSYNTEVKANLVADIPIKDKSTVTIIDSNTNQEVIDPSMLFFIGGDSIIASTLTQKDNTLFLGNIILDSGLIPEDISSEPLTRYDTNTGIFEASNITFDIKRINIDPIEGYYSDILESSDYSSLDIKTFKHGEIYRFAIQFQTVEGNWTTPLWIGDKKCDIFPHINTEENYINLPNAKFIMPETLRLKLRDKYINYRILMAETNNLNRSILAQGVVNPTMFNYGERNLKGPYAISSWIMRPRGGNTKYEHLDNTGNISSYGPISEITTWGDVNPEIQGLYLREAPVITSSIEGNEIISIGLLRGHKANVWYGSTKDNGELNELYYTTLNGNNWTHVYSLIVEFLNSVGVTLEDLTVDAFISFIDHKYTTEVGGVEYIDGTNNKWTRTNPANIASHKWLVQLVGNNPIDGKDYVLTHEKQVPNINDKALDIESKRNNFYIDSSILTFNSPELEYLDLDDSSLKFRIVGLIPITGNYSDIEADITPGYNNNSYLNKNNISNVLNSSIFGGETLVSENLYIDSVIKNNTLDNTKVTTYDLFMWHKQGSILGVNEETQGIDNYGENKAVLNHKIMGTLRYSNSTNYFSSYKEYPISSVIQYDSNNLDFKELDIDSTNNLYLGNYDKLLTFKSDEGYNVTHQDGLNTTFVYDPVRIKYKTTPHAIIPLYNSTTSTFNILPYLKDNNESPMRIEDLYEDVGNKQFAWGDYNFTQDYIEDVTCQFPYLYIGELYRDIPYDSLYGGHTESALQQINWLPISNITSIDTNVTKTEGDTYFQRWDCLKTYPYTEEDINSVVDITSFMVETHINLEGRYDRNKGINNLLNSRPTNFNLVNKAYSQSNNFFTYNILDDKFNTSTYSNQIVFSLEKVANESIDTWCSINTSSALNLDGKFGKITKLVTLNNTIIALQDKAISAINFNNKTALSTTVGVPIEIANSGKVNGYSIITDNAGCQNKESICKSKSGLYFIDHYNKALYNINGESFTDISSKGFSIWFKESLNGSEKLYYDNLTNDVYIVNNDNCLNYNELLQSFVSFLPYTNSESIFNIEDNSIMIDKDLNVLEMFKGQYSKDYYIQYRVNPEPFVDKVFTNIEYVSDCLPTEVSVNNTGMLNDSPFDKLSVWNEYQEGETLISNNNKYPKFDKKFRIWRVDIPRAKNTLRDRIRNPWIHLKLSKENLNQTPSKIMFHNLFVKYYK